MRIAEENRKYMNQNYFAKPPDILEKIQDKCAQMGFSMSSDLCTGSLLKTLVASKPHSNFLELGTGIGLSLCWMIDGMDQKSRLISLDNDPDLIEIAQTHFGDDPRIELICQDGNKWIESSAGKAFDLVFADAWPGKYSKLNETLDMLKIGGLYVIDDMCPQLNWPSGHEKAVKKLIQALEERDDFSITKLNWSTGIIIASKRF